MTDNTYIQGGLGLSEVLFVVFLTLKLCDKIDWSWLWVTSPLWIPLVLALCFILFMSTIDFFEKL